MHVKDIAVIGGGPCGIAAAEAFVKEQAFRNIVIYERRSTTGGLWNYSDQTGDPIPIPSDDPHKTRVGPVKGHDGELVWPSAMYKSMDTNVPTPIMTYADTPFPKDVALYATREEVLKYTRDYAKRVEHLIRFNTQVLDLDKENDKWIVTSQDINGLTKTDKFDAVCLACGHYDLPYLPNKKGLVEWNKKYPGSISHSKFYRKPEDFTDKRVIIIGNSASGNDLAFQICQYSKPPVYLSGRSESLMPSVKDDRIKKVGDVKEFNAETRSAVLVNGEIIHDIDNILFATGYMKSLPIVEKINKGPYPLITNGGRVHNLYLHFLYIPDPTLAIVGLPMQVLPMPISQAQAAYIARVWSGRLKLPPVSEQRQYDENIVKEKGNGSGYHLMPFPEGPDYADDLRQRVLKAPGNYGLVPQKWDDYLRGLNKESKILKDRFVRLTQATGRRPMTRQELEQNPDALNGSHI